MLFDGGIHDQVALSLAFSEDQELMVVGFDLILLNQVFCFVAVISNHDIANKVFFFFKFSGGNDFVDLKNPSGKGRVDLACCIKLRL